MKNKYEAMLILRANHGEEERKNVVKQVEDIFSKNGATVLSSNIWLEKRRFAYPIKKQMEGMYCLINFEAPSEAVAKIKPAISLADQVLRMLLVKN